MGTFYNYTKRYLLFLAKKATSYQSDDRKQIVQQVFKQSFEYVDHLEAL